MQIIVSYSPTPYTAKLVKIPDLSQVLNISVFQVCVVYDNECLLLLLLLKIDVT